MKKVILTIIFCLAVLPVLLFSESPFTLITQPTLLLPSGPETEEGVSYYSMGGGAMLEGELNFKKLNFLFLGPQFEYSILPIHDGSKNLTYFNFGGNMGLKLTPFSRSIFRIWGGGGGSYGMLGDASSLFPYYAGGADLTFRLTQSFNLGVGGRYIQGESSAGTIYQATGATLTLGYNFQSSSAGATLKVVPFAKDIFPLYYTWYDENALGEVTITNDSSEVIKNVRAGFYVPQYMEQPKYSDGEVQRIGKGKSATLPLQGLFSNNIFEINEGLKVAGEVIVQYTYFGNEVKKSYPLTITINNKNAMTWDDDRKAACFVTANNPLIYSYARNLSGEIRGGALSALDKNFQIGMGLFESLSLYGIGYVVDPSSSYKDLSASEEVVDYIQFPQQTLISKAGDCDDISVLYASMLEASGIPAAFITIPGHIYVAYKLGLDERAAKKNFPNSNDLLYIDDETWLPVEITLVKEGFLASWQIGAKQIRENDGKFGFFPVREAWQTYPAAEYESSGLAYLPDPKDVVTRYSQELRRFLKREVNLQIARIDGEIREKGATPILLNQKGVTYARYGFLDEARSMFELVIAKDSFYPSMMNLGNIHYLNNNPTEAALYYNKALLIKPDSEKALIGLARVSSELEDYTTADAALASLQSINPVAAGEVSHLGTGGIGRASAAQSKEVDEWTE